MLRLAADENFNAAVVRGLLRRIPSLDIVTIQNAGLSGAHDANVLDWAADEGPILLTNDVATLLGYAPDRIRSGQPVPALLAVRSKARIGSTIDDLVLLA